MLSSRKIIPKRTKKHTKHKRLTHTHSSACFSVTSKQQSAPNTNFCYVYDVIRIGSSVKEPTLLATNIFEAGNTTLSQSNQVTSYGPPNRKFVFLHALLASRTYFKPFIRTLHTHTVKQFPHIDAIDIYIPDQAHHGDSPFFNNNINLSDTTQFDYLTDLATKFNAFLLQEVLHPLAPEKDLSDVSLLGHSLGARVLLLWHLLLQHKHQYVTDGSKLIGHSDELINMGLSRMKIVSLDASPTKYEHNHNQLIEAMISAQQHDLQNCAQIGDLVLSTTPKIKEHLISAGIDTNTIAFALQNNLAHNLVSNISQEYGKITTSHHTHNKLYHDLFDRYATQFIQHKTNQFNSKSYFWKSDLETIFSRESDVFNWPLDPNEHFSPLSQNVLFIGGLNSNRLIKESYLSNLRKQYPESRVEMVRGGHFVQMGPDQSKVAEHSLNHLL